MTTFTHDGTVFDLDAYEWVDAIGVPWVWSGGWSDGEPLMRGSVADTLVPLPDVYRDHGPLIPRPRAGLPKRQRPSAGFLATLAAGFVETDEAFAVRISGGGRA